MTIRDYAVVIATLILSGVGHPAHAQTTPYAMDCISVTEMRSDNMAPQLARSIRDCLDQHRFSDAMQLFFAYTIYADFDRKKVLDERQNGAVIGLHYWVLSGYPRPVINELRYYSNALRDQTGNFFKDTCSAISAVGPPTYVPYYLVGRGMEFETAKSDWQVADFDERAVWRQSLALNGCMPS